MHFMKVSLACSGINPEVWNPRGAWRLCGVRLSKVEGSLLTKKTPEIPAKRPYRTKLPERLGQLQCQDSHR